MSISIKVKDFLDENEVEYTTITHSKAYTAQRIASSSMIPGSEMAKTVVVKVDGNYALAVLPAPEKLDLKQFAENIGVGKIELASETEFRNLFEDCETGAMSPFGNLYNLKTYISTDFTKHRMITFNAGNHVELIRMRYSTFEKLVNPIIIDIDLHK